MKVNGSTDPLRLDVATGKPAAKAGNGPRASTESASSVRLSASLSAADQSSEFDAARVSQLKDAIRDGRFEVDSGVVADKLIANVNDLFGKVH
jgi:negative regulator of flagellin synthesis FlgM